MQRLGVFSPRGFARSPQRLNVLGWYHVLGAVMIFLMGNLLGVLLAPPPAAKAGIWDSWSLIVSDTSGKILGIAAILWIAQRAFVEPVGRPGGLGWNWRRFGGGFWRGIAAYLLLLPVLIMVADMTSAVLKWQHAPKPPVHPLLTALASHPPLGFQIALILLACVSAPIGEELFFRGLLQSYLVQLFAWMGKAIGASREPPASSTESMAPPQSGAAEGITMRPAAAEEEKSAAAGDFSSQTGPHPAVISADDATAPPFWREVKAPAPIRCRHRWAGILITAVIFAGVHMVMANGAIDWFPILFLLGIGLGYLYERTGNLWADMTLHASFNGVSVLLITYIGLPKPGHP